VLWKTFFHQTYNLSYFCRYIVRQQQQIRTLIILNQNTMKRLLALTLMGLMLTVVFAACGSSKGGHCDAYGKAPAEQVDLAE
jgi:multisubunit Na+/H+ antiporter MnhC subunit